MKLKNKGFTLVELIVLITILSILGIIAILFLQSYTLNARDGARISDIKSIQRALGLYIIQRSRFPEPTNPVNITYSGATVWTQGTFGDTTFMNVGIVNKKPIDPLKFVDYSYSITNDKIDYLIGGVMESSEIASLNPIINKTNAETSHTRAYVTGPYNGLATKVNTGGVDYVLAIPSILTNNLNQTDINQIYSNKSFVYNNYGNLPSNFSGAFNTSFGFDFVPKKLVLYTGSLNDLTELSNQLLLLQNIQDSYSGAIILNDDEQIKKIVDIGIDPQNPSSKAKVLACTVINFSVKHFVECNDIDYVTYYVINVLHIDITNLPGNTINSVVQTSNGDLRFGTDGGVGYYNGTTWTIYNTGNSGIVSNTVLAMAQASDGNMWFGTNLGISVFDGTTWATLNQQNSGLKQNHILEIFTGTDGKMRIGTNAGVSTYDSGVWQSYTKQNTGITHNQVNAIYEDNQGNIWFGTKQGLDKFKNGVVTKYKTTQGLINNEVFYIMQDTSNNMRFGTHSGISKFNWTTFSNKTTTNTSGGLPSNYITYIYQNETNGDMWFGTNNGAAKYVEGTNTWTTYNTSNQLSGNDIHSINQNNNGDIIIMNDGGVDTITN